MNVFRPFRSHLYRLIALSRRTAGLATILSIVGITSSACQTPPDTRPSLITPGLDRELCDLLPFEVPLIGVPQLTQLTHEAMILDARAPEEFRESHIPGAQLAGFKTFDASLWENLPRDTLIVTYCSVGYRSDLIGQRLRKMGFSNVHNLYGSLFEWANQGLPLVNGQGDTVKTLHTYNADWSKWVVRRDLKKVW